MLTAKEQSFSYLIAKTSPNSSSKSFKWTSVDSVLRSPPAYPILLSLSPLPLARPCLPSGWLPHCFFDRPELSLASEVLSCRSDASCP
ncbi:hypothetical protein AFLA_009538 [Aspergillus flavus NRRL3357]|nr:hypothetical protein AFLA_009538 [Aspergillus flavus NRRL3357]